MGLFDNLGVSKVLGGLFGDAPEAPDYSGIANANEKSAQLAKEAADNQLAFSKDQYAFLQPYLKNQLQTGQDVAAQQLADSKKASERSDEQWQQYQETFQPIEEKMAKEAMDYGGEADQERATGQAAADVSQQFQSQRAAAQRQLASMGVKPNSGAFMAQNREADAAEAAARAAAMTGTRQAVKDKGVSLRAGAAAFGRNQTNTAGQQVGLSTGAGSSATQSAGAGVGSTLAAGNSLNAGYGAQIGAAGTTIQSNLGLGSLLNSAYGNEAQLYGAQMAGLGQLAGTAAGLYAKPAAGAAVASSKDFKEGKQPFDSREAVEAFKRLNVDSWKYKDGIADGGRHVGPYAEDVQRELGDEVAPGGKQIDLISMSGAQAAAIKGLAEKMEQQDDTIEALTARLAAMTRGGKFGLRGYV
ncbi:tail fiber domain-containing protein [Zoogloea sp. 1C4]|uniref:tail fiber domain-containing protein n=1 Tax=Zoogloea sp. 1C4 TaxID=2570190 RepID=UPI0012926650|nr:tail fiber domain-containing protein [Zoogloea sp. 1C4]